MIWNLERTRSAQLNRSANRSLIDGMPHCLDVWRMELSTCYRQKASKTARTEPALPGLHKP